MKVYYKDTMIKIFLGVLLSFSVQARVVGVIQNTSGKVFTVFQGKTTIAKKGDSIEEFSEFITEVGAKLIFTDYFDHEVSLAGSGHISFIQNYIELKRGYLSLKALEPNREVILETANAKALFQGGETILSYDSAQRKTQALVVRGKLEFANMEDDFSAISLNDHEFSFVHKEFNNGVPRRASLIGKSSYKKIVSLFSDEKILMEKIVETKKSKINQALSRKPASISNLNTVGKLTLIKEKVKKVVKKKIVRQKIKRKVNKIKVNIFNFTKKEEIARAPASISQEEQNFKKSLKTQTQKQKRHNSEVNQLINELENYKADFSLGY
ncbi:MAG: hypothetical protein HOJ35_12485 [Bdellovibrionales bacterium]|nr:hypothetical protein [Bdellovibrionales bacterium]